MSRSLFGLALFALGCSSTPPPAWASGGARLELADATWTLDGSTVALRKDGRVTSDGSLAFTIDVAGRVYDEDREPVAVLLPDGAVQGTDQTTLGRVGVTNASPPGAETAWLQVSPDGAVMLYDADGERRAAGRWSGCGGPVLRSCTFVTHLVVLARAARAQRSSMMFGVGVGVYR